MLEKTADRSAAKACPSRVVQSSCTAIMFTMSGKRTSATKLGSKPALTAASCSGVPFSVAFFFSHALSSLTFAGSPAHMRICARSWSGYRAIGASRRSISSAEGAAAGFFAALADCCSALAVRREPGSAAIKASARQPTTSVVTLTVMSFFILSSLKCRGSVAECLAGAWRVTVPQGRRQCP